MKTDTELESLLRSTLAGRAHAIDDAPAWTAPAPAPARARRRRMPAVAAAAVVAAVAVGVVVGARATHSSQPSHQTPSPTPTVVPTVCPTALPAQWRAAVSAALIDAGGRTATPLSVASDGSVIAVRDDGVHPGDGREVVRLRPGSAPQVLYSIPSPDALTADSADLVGHWLVVGLRGDARPPKGTTPGSTPIGLDSVVVVDLSTGHVRTLATAHDHRLAINSLALFDGKAYWDERPSYGARMGVVKSYDPRTGATATAYRGPVSWLEVTGAGLVFYDDREHPLVAANLPAPVQNVMTTVSLHYLATDGAAYAWLASPKIVGWWAPGNAAPIYHKLARAVDTDQGAAHLLVAGRFIVTEQGALIDAVSGAAATLRYASAGQGGMYLAGAGVLAGRSETERKGRWIDGYWADAATAVLRIDTRALPPLTC